MPRNPAAAVVSGIFGLAWAAIGLALAAWAAATALDAARGFDLAVWALGHSPFGLPWDPVEAAAWAVGNLAPFAIAAAVALVLGWTNLRAARIALRAANESHDGKGHVQLVAREAPRVGRPVEGSIMLRDAPMPGDEFDVVLTGGAFRAQQRVRARQGAHGVSLPFRFEVPATASPSSVATPWRLEFARAGRRAFPSPSRIGFTLAPAPAKEVAALHDSPLPPSAARGTAEHVASLADAFGVKLSQAQRERMHRKLSGPGAAVTARQLEMFRQLTPQHVKYIKYGLIAFFVLFFFMPFALSVLALVLGRIFA